MSKKRIFLIISLILLFLFVSVVLVYRIMLSPVSHEDILEEVIIENNTNTKTIGKILDEKGLIRSNNFFSLYVKINNINNLKAGKYEINKNMSLKEIIELLQKGNNYNNQEIKITFKEGINFRQFAKVVDENTNNTYEDVIAFASLNNADYLKSLIDDYWFITDDILNKDIYYPLEGYLAPDTYFFRSKDITTAEIIKKLLDQTNDLLTPYKDRIENSNYSVHELLTLASVAEKEVNNKNDRKKVTSVFINRISKGISLGSDITTRYGIKLDDSRALKSSEYASVNPYNTRNTSMKGLPAGPIAMVSISSIEASIAPDNTNYLYFISNIETNETFFFEYSSDFEKKKSELKSVNGGY